jgi:hypothetical protein
VSKLSKKARNAMVAKAALSVARDHLTPPAKPKRRRGRKLLLGGLLAALGAGIVLKRDKVVALLPGHSEDVAPPPPPAPPAPSNYDIGGPAANTATPVPAPDPVQPPAIDEAAEEAAAAAEAANIGGPAPDYAAAAEPAALAPDEERPLEEAGEGESEGQEQAEADLADTIAEPQAAERRLEDTIEAAGDPAAGETPEPVTPPEEKPIGESGGGSEWRTWSGRSVNP